MTAITMLDDIIQDAIDRALIAADLFAPVSFIDDEGDEGNEDDEGNEFLMYYLEPGNACALSMMCAARDEKSQIMVKAVEPSEIVLIPSHFTVIRYI